MLITVAHIPVDASHCYMNPSLGTVTAPLKVIRSAIILMLNLFSSYMYNCSTILYVITAASVWYDEEE